MIQVKSNQHTQYFVTSILTKLIMSIDNNILNSSQGVQVNNTLYVSGQVGINPDTKAIVPGGAVEEADQALKNIGAILEAAGSSYDNVVKCTVLLSNIADFAAVNEVYSKYFPNKKPARAAYQAAALPLGANVEIEAIAIVGEIVDA